MSPRTRPFVALGLALGVTVLGYLALLHALGPQPSSPAPSAADSAPGLVVLRST